MGQALEIFPEPKNEAASVNSDSSPPLSLGSPGALRFQSTLPLEAP